MIVIVIRMIAAGAVHDASAVLLRVIGSEQQHFLKKRLACTILRHRHLTSRSLNYFWLRIVVIDKNSATSTAE